MKFITRTGDGFLYPLFGVFLLLLDRSKGLNIALSVLLAFTIELPIFRIIKLKTTRLRPFETIPGIKHLIQPPDRYSFPSGHTAGAFIMAMIISNVLSVLFIPLVIWAVAVGVSRIYLGVHYPTDVLVGGIGGIFSALTAEHLVYSFLML
jgi:undecaprenyl-diphosphatase